MRAILATLIGLLMVWMQAVASVSPHLVEQKIACACCRCGNPGCATQTNVPAPTTSPTVSCSISENITSSPPIQVAIEQPVPAEAADASTASAGAGLPPALPIFQRHCALLL